MCPISHMCHMYRAKGGSQYDLGERDLMGERKDMELLGWGNRVWKELWGEVRGCI